MNVVTLIIISSNCVVSVSSFSGFMYNHAQLVYQNSFVCACGSFPEFSVHACMHALKGSHIYSI